MTPRTSRSSIKSEDGFALVLVLLALMVITGLTVAMVTSGRTEVLISVNQERAAEARAAAEAGLNHAISTTVTYLANWQANGFASSSAAMTRLLRGPDNAVGTAGTDADNGSLETLGIPRLPARVALNPARNTAYDAWVLDEDHAVRNLLAADHVRLSENSVGTLDANKKLVIRATGYGGGETRVTLEAAIGPISLPAIVTNDSLTIPGNPRLIGANGSAHSNVNLRIDGNPTISQDATASGTYTLNGGSATIMGQSGGGRPVLTIPPINAIDYKPLAEFIFRADGRMTLPDGVTVVCNAAASNDACKNAGYGFIYEPGGAVGGGPAWNISGDVAPNANNRTFYFEGSDAKMSGNPGSPVNPLVITIIAEGNIDLSGTPDLRADSPGLLFVTNKDLKIGGNLTQHGAEAQMLVREQLMISGNPTLFGQILVQNVPGTSTLVVENSISGNPTITYNGLFDSNTYAVTGWREIR